MNNFNIFKNKEKKADNHPDYIISFKNNSGEWEEWGACWLKKKDDGETFMSCAKAKPKPEEVNREYYEN